MSSLLFYNVENSTNKEKTLQWGGVSKLLTGTVYCLITQDGYWSPVGYNIQVSSVS